MNKVIILIEDGAAQALYATDPDTQIILVDRDNISEGDPSPISHKDIAELSEKATENCRAEIKAGKFFRVW